MLMSRSLRLASRHSFEAVATSISTIPSGMPATRQAMEISSAGEVMACSSIVCSIADGRMAPRKVAMITMPTASRRCRVRGPTLFRSSASRRCSLRSMAITDPSITR
jgi:hypothetical protein